MGKIFTQGDPLHAVNLKKTGKIRKQLAASTDIAAMPGKAKFNDLTPKRKIVDRSVADLKPSPRMVRKTTSAQLKRVCVSITEHTFIGAILVRGDVVVDGHTRLAAMKALGCETIPTIDISGLTDDQCKAVALSMNRIAELGEWDPIELRETVIELEVAGLSLDASGFTSVELDIIKLTPEAEDIGALDALPEEVPGPPVTKLGDQWILGNHKLLCGSCLEQANYNQLMEGEVATMLFTDPPYNVKIAGNVSGLGKVKHDDFAMGCGEQSDEEFTEFLATPLKLSKAHLAAGAAVYAFMDWRHISHILQAGGSAGLTLINVVIWDKGSGAMGAFYRSAHELLPVFCNGPKLAINNVMLGANGRDRSNVWSYPGANRSGSSANAALAGHPTPKSVELVRDALLDASHPGDIVLDPFMGSGTTIIAAEECQRAARGFELAPKYVDLTVRRWEEVTGEQATLHETGETFAQVAERRQTDAI